MLTSGSQCAGILQSRALPKSSHEQDALLHCLGKAADARLLIQGLAVVDDGDVAAERSQIPRGVMMQILFWSQQCVTYKAQCALSQVKCMQQ